MGVKLYLLRHGHSPSVSDAGVASDAARPLSDRGRADVRKTIAALIARGAKPALILHSPLKRAVQTSEEAEKLVKPALGRRVFEPLSNVLAADALAEALRAELEGAGELLAVGHQPQLGELASFLSGQIFDLQPAGLIALEPAQKRASVLWSLNPQDLPDK